MNLRALRHWLAPAMCILLGLLGAGLVEAGFLPGLVFVGSFRFGLGILILAVGLLAGLVSATGIAFRLRLRRRTAALLAGERAARDQERKQFLRRLDHELKNPVTTIRLGIANLDGKDCPSEEQNASVERIAHQAQRLQSLVEDLRRLAEMEESSLDRTEVNLPQVLGEAIEMACEKPEWQARKVQLVIQQVPWPLSAFSGDRDLLALAFRNLVENALKFSGPDGQVEVRASEDGHVVLVEVDDNGRGILAEDLPHVFDELYRGENARDLPGSGLGLALARRVVELHGGTIEIHSRPEQGTMMRVRLPLANSG